MPENKEILNNTNLTFVDYICECFCPVMQQKSVDKINLIKTELGAKYRNKQLMSGLDAFSP